MPMTDAKCVFILAGCVRAHACTARTSEPYSDMMPGDVGEYILPLIQSLNHVEATSVLNESTPIRQITTEYLKQCVKYDHLL